MSEILFYVFAVVAIAAAVLSISRKNAVAAACWLVLMFFGLAGTFVLLEAYFVAAVQVLVYAGAIMVLFLFVIMLLDLRNEELAILSAPRFRLPGLVAAGGFLVLAVLVIWRTGDLSPSAFAAHPSGGPDGGAGSIGEVLFNRWLLAFEVTSLLLLGAMLGAVILTKRRLT
jgi:NADH-quinone oxidoreductase subunit J